MPDKPELQVDTKNGPVLGFRDVFPLGEHSGYPGSPAKHDKSHHRPALRKWLGIPFAQAERWTRPRAPEPWTEPLQAYDYGVAPPQPPSTLTKMFEGKQGVYMRSHYKQSEHGCLTLNVFAPDLPNEQMKGLPVLHWQYGGALNTGSCDRMSYDPTEWVRRQQAAGEPVIIVTSNMRVNIYGFFAHPDLAKVDPDGLAGNYGLYDTIAALEWTRDNIEAFGGDANNVCVVGESAGAFVISQLLVCGRKLFTRAILQSGFAATCPVAPLVEQYSYRWYPQLLELAGVDVESSTAVERVEALRKLDTDTLNEWIMDPQRMHQWGMVLESGSQAIWREPTNLKIERGEIDPWVEEIILGCNEDEGTLFCYSMQLWNRENLERRLALTFGNDFVKAAEEMYPPTPKDQRPEEFTSMSESHLIGDWIFQSQCFHMAQSLAKLRKTTVRLYRYQQTVHRLFDGYGFGSMHAAELTVLFNCDSLWEKESVEAKTSQAIGSRWAAFAKGAISDWPLYEPDSAQALYFKADGSTKIGDLKPDEQKQALWIGALLGVSRKMIGK
ncbi:uncharacterized protein L969DRAFT_93637 [Mixia osmundae IAM 14324]|uniref:Carboxylic ester hydrolase n=1 Tax=Mixia osmundae (strain CBS 9802 / IAM 14324 / JCM 22182 / KY 12970) TaxID=764103 RepID=G7E956_MIXOS|nr:uncharacterized protein L969DRAFT_93637 [Mixia osmundae IAM 14324]KEI39795.1 hypothetical protein L969DRAFT_93637 [Mixia osmundae IAM 14324]GAA99175.1 hypothetical protein E5Q_05867 [Mixia osmundae IAM 14324]